MSTTPAAPETSAPPNPRRWSALAVVLLAVFMDLIDITIVVVAAPAIGDDLDASYSEIQWVMAAYALSLGLLLITGGRLGDILGRKRLFLTGVALFTAASAACGLAPTIEFLIAARVIQGAAAAMMIPQVLATIQVDFPREERPKAFGFYGAVNGIAAAAAPILGGLLVGHNTFGLEWRTVFWINVPIGVIALIGGTMLMRESREYRRPELDWTGVALISGTLLLLLYPLIQGAAHGWPWWTWAMMAGSGLGAVVVTVHQTSRQRAGHLPLLPIGLFVHRSFLFGLATAFVMFSSIAALFLVLTFQLQAGHGFSALRVGLTFMAWPIGLFLSAGAAASLVGKLGRRLVAIGAAVLVAAMAALSIGIGIADGDLGTWHLVPGLALGGIGFGLVAPVVVDFVLSSVPESDAGGASGAVNTIVQIAGAVGIASVGAIFQTAMDSGAGFDTAAQRALIYPTAAFALGMLLTRGLPAKIRTEHGASDA